MNTLQDLRQTLESHAATVHDDIAHARTAVVRGRARAVRRNRAVAVAGAAAVALAAVIVPMSLLDGRDPMPAERELIGREAPETLTSLGYTYRFVDGVESTDSRPARLRLGESDLPRLVTWASEADDVTVTVNVDGYGGLSERTDFDDFMLVPGVETPKVTVRAKGAESALAVYELDPDALPDGTTEDGLTFREQIGSERLIDAEVGRRGDSDITLEVTVPESERIRVAEFCGGVPEEDKLWVNVSVEGDGAVSSGGCEDDPFDPAVGNATWLEDRHLPEPGEAVSVRMWISRGVLGGGEPVEADDVRLALAAYDVGAPAAEVAGWDIPPLLEHEGHLWSFVTTEEAARGGRRVTSTNTSPDTVLVEASLSGAGSRTVSFREPAHGGVDRTGTGNGSGMIGILRPGEQASLTVRGEPEPTTRMGFAVYERLD